MKAEVNEFGILILLPENMTEQYAVSCWKDGAYVKQEDVTRCEKGHYRESLVRVSLCEVVL